MGGSNLYQAGTRLRFRKPVEILVFKEEFSESHTIEPGVECVIKSVEERPAVEIVSDEIGAALRLWLSPNIDWSEYFEVIQYKHLCIVK